MPNFEANPDQRALTSAFVKSSHVGQRSPFVKMKWALFVAGRTKGVFLLQAHLIESRRNPLKKHGKQLKP